MTYLMVNVPVVAPVVTVFAPGTRVTGLPVIVAVPDLAVPVAPGGREMIAVPPALTVMTLGIVGVRRTGEPVTVPVPDVQEL